MCSPCTIGFWKEAVGNDYCDSCELGEQGTTPAVGATSRALCGCTAGFFLPEPNGYPRRAHSLRAVGTFADSEYGL
jgi:hypothetical protein